METLSVFAKGLFVGQTVLITGGGTGIGLATARLLGGLGARVVLCARTLPRLEEAAQSLRDQGIEACGRAVDIRKEHSVDSLFAGLLADGWFPDSLINNAGGQFAAPALDITPNGFRAVVDLNLTGSWLMSVAFARHFRALGRSSGSIVSIVLAQASGMPGMVHAAAARAGVVNMMKTLAYEWGPSGLTANAIAPGTRCV